MLLSHDLVDDAPLREACHLRFPKVLKEAVCLEEHDTLQALLLPLKDLHPALDETLNLHLLLLNHVRLLLQLKLAVPVLNTSDDFRWYGEPLGVLGDEGRHHKLVDLSANVRADVDEIASTFVGRGVA